MEIPLIVWYAIVIVLIIAFVMWYAQTPAYKQYEALHKDDPSSMNCGIGWSKHPFIEC